MNRQEAEELLPWYVAGVLSEEETRGVEAFIASGQITRASLDELTLLKESVREVGAEEPHYDPGVLDRVMTRLDAVPQLPPEEPIIVRAPVRRSGAIAALLERLQWSLTPKGVRVALAAQLLLVIGLGAALWLQSDTPQRAQFDVAGRATAGDFSVAFAADATEADIRSLLIDSDASIVSGPSALGLYTLDIADEADQSAARSRLEESPLVRLLQPVAR